MNRGIILTCEEQSEIIEWIYKEKRKFIVPRKCIFQTPSDIISLLSPEPDFFSRYSVDPNIYSFDTTVPSIVWDIKKRIIEKEKLQNYQYDPHFYDYIYICPTGFIFPAYIDPNIDNLIQCRFNVFLELPKLGGKLYCNGTLVDANERSYVCCKSGIEYQWCSKPDLGNIIAISYGFVIPREDIDTISSYDISLEKINMESSPPRLPTLPKTHFDLFKDLQK